MSNKSTIESINSYWDSLIDTGLISCSELCDCINALEKQIPKKPIIKPFNELMRMKVCHHIKCPSCDYQLNFLEFKNDKERIFKDMSEWSKYCYECGQKLDWD